MFDFVQIAKKGKWKYLHLCPNFWTNQSLDQWSTLKWSSEPQLCVKWTYIWQKNGRKWSLHGHLSVSFISNQTIRKIALRWTRFLVYFKLEFYKLQQSEKFTSNYAILPLSLVPFSKLHSDTFTKSKKRQKESGVFSWKQQLIVYPPRLRKGLCEFWKEFSKTI